MTAHILPLRPAAGSSVITRGERRAAAMWCAFRGPDWAAEALSPGDGRVALGIITPFSRTDAYGTALPAWVIWRKVGGLTLMNAKTFGIVGLYPSINAALEEVVRVEGLAAVNDNAAA